MDANRPVEPVKLMVAVLWREPVSLEAARRQLESHWGAIDWQGRDHPFTATRYYDEEMGAPLFRRLIGFERLVAPDGLAQAKQLTKQIEDQLAEGGRRTVNLDVGYLDHHKLVLASFKGAGQKIYLGGGVYADLVARYSRGGYRPFEWTFPDFRTGEYDSELLQLRARYLVQRRDLRASAGGVAEGESWRA